MSESAFKTHLAQRDLVRLLEHRSTPSLSIYLPHLPGQPLALGLLQALKEAETQLDASGLNALEIQTLLAPAYAFAKTECPTVTEGLALYCAAANFMACSCPDLEASQCQIDDYFQLLPLLTHYLRVQPFYLLCLDEQNNRLFSVAESSFAELPLGQGHHDSHFLQSSLRQHLSQHLLAEETLVLVVAESPQPFQRLCSELLQAGLNYACHYLEPAQSPESMYVLARQRARDLLTPSHQQLIAQYLQHQEAGETVEELMTLTRAAYNSRVKTLFLVANLPQELGTAEQQQRAELLNRATIYTYLNGGQIHIAQPEELGGERQAAAILRY